jgi:hypothetical protein
MKSTTASFQTSQSADLDSANLTFHSIYDELTARGAEDAPALVVFPDAFFLFRANAWTEHSLTTRGFHELKGVAHVPLALFALVTKSKKAGDESETTKAILAVKNAADRASRSLGEFPETSHEDVTTTLRAAIAFADLVLGKNTSEDATSNFARDVGPTLLKLTEHATRLQLANLDEIVEKVLETMSESETKTLRVVVAGDHQARARNLAMQYFAHRLGETVGAESRLTYAEGVDTPQAALDLLGVQQIDRTIAAAFFGDPKRLQRDVLGDAAAKLLKQAKIKPIR